jgi:uncharacterized membrane protein (UPF0127 family)
MRGTKKARLPPRGISGSRDSLVKTIRYIFLNTKKFYPGGGGLLWAMVLILGCHSSSIRDQVCFKDICFDVEVVRTSPERERGLMFRPSLDPRRGMLFVFTQSAHHRFWMKNTLIPLDMIWLDHARRVVHIAPNVPPCKIDPCPTYGPENPAIYVLELNAGQAEKIGLALGVRMDFRIRSH